MYVSMYVCILNKVSLCSPAWPGTHCGDQTGLDLDPPASGIKGHHFQLCLLSCQSHRLVMVHPQALSSIPVGFVVSDTLLPNDQTTYQAL